MLDDAMRQSLIDCIEWTLSRAEGSHVEIDIYTVREVLRALKGEA